MYNAAVLSDRSLPLRTATDAWEDHARRPADMHGCWSMLGPFLVRPELADRALRGARGELGAHYRAGRPPGAGPDPAWPAETLGLTLTSNPCAANAHRSWLRGPRLRLRRTILPRPSGIPDQVSIVVGGFRGLGCRCRGTSVSRSCPSGRSRFVVGVTGQMVGSHAGPSRPSDRGGSHVSGDDADDQRRAGQGDAAAGRRMEARAGGPQCRTGTACQDPVCTHRAERTVPGEAEAAAGPGSSLRIGWVANGGRPGVDTSRVSLLGAFLFFVVVSGR